MEEQRFYSRAKSFRRLLSVFLVLFIFNFSLSAKFITYNDIKNLSFSVAAGQDLVTNTEIKFFVDIPYVSPSEVEIETPLDTENVTFTSSRRIQSDLSNEGTVVELWFSFAKKGTYRLPSLLLKIQGIKREIEFKPVTIKFNPKEQAPVLIVKFDNGIVLSSEGESYSDFKNKVEQFSIVAGKRMGFTVYIQYGVQLISFNWDIPKDSIFTQTKTYAIIDNQIADTNAQDDLVPVCDFEWMPLVPGKMNFPSIKLTVTGYSGFKSDIHLPDFSVNILENTDETIVHEDGFFQDAFTEVKKVVAPVEVTPITKDVCLEIANLRIKERHSILNKAKQKRIQLEQSYDLPSTRDEFKFFYIYLALFFVVASIVLFILFLRKKKFFLNMISSTLLVISLSFFIGILRNINREHAVSMGCTLYSIPEINAESKSELLPGSYVQIKEKNGDWLYVNLGETGGWCKKDNFIIIK